LFDEQKTKVYLLQYVFLQLILRYVNVDTQKNGMDNGTLNSLFEKFKQADIEKKREISQQIARLSDKHELFTPEHILYLGEMLLNADDSIQYDAAYMLVNIAEYKCNIYPLLEKITIALEKGNIKTKKELVWALYCIASENKDISKASEVLIESMVNSESLKANGSIALTLHFLNINDSERASDLLNVGDVYIQFGAIWASVEYYNRTENEPKLRELFSSVPFGISSPQIRQAILGYFEWAKRAAHNIDFSVRLLRKMIIETKHDPVKQSPLTGIMLKI